MASSGQQLTQNPPSLDELRLQHQDHEERLEELKAKSWLSPEEEVEEKTLKKLKLRLKDQMARLKRAAS